MSEKRTCSRKKQKYGVVGVVVVEKINGGCCGDLKPKNSTNQKRNRGQKRKRKEEDECISSPQIEVEEVVVIGCERNLAKGLKLFRRVGGGGRSVVIVAENRRWSKVRIVFGRRRLEERKQCNEQQNWDNVRSKEGHHLQQR